MAMRSMKGKMQMSANVNCSPQRYGPLNFCKSVSIVFSRSSRSVDSLTRLVAD